jgi:predicted membrane protein
VTALPLLGVIVIGPTVASKVMTRSAGASPILIWVAVCWVVGGTITGGGVVAVVLEELPPQAKVARVSPSISVIITNWLNLGDTEREFGFVDIVGS